VDTKHIESLEKCGQIFLGTSPDGHLPEIVEIMGHPLLIGVQVHPELKLKPLIPHPLFTDLSRTAKVYRPSENLLVLQRRQSGWCDDPTGCGLDWRDNMKGAKMARVAARVVWVALQPLCKRQRQQQGWRRRPHHCIQCERSAHHQSDPPDSGTEHPSSPPSQHPGTKTA
jgi:hypothetical protein